MRRTLFLVSAYFPPDNGVASVRVTKFCRYLAGLDWRVVVFCPDRPEQRFASGEAIAAELPEGVRVVRVPRSDLLSKWVRYSKAKLNGRLIGPLLTPDEYALWSRRVSRAVIQEASVQAPDVIVTTCSPFSLNLVGLAAKEQLGIPWVTDFRDLWLDNPLSSVAKTYAFQDRQARRLQDKVFRGADGIVANTDLQQQILCAYPATKDEAVRVIRNGYDRADLPTEARKPRAEEPCPLRIALVGSIYHDYQPMTLVERLHEIDADLEFHYIGNQGDELCDLFREKGLPLPNCQESRGLGDYYRFLQEMDFGLVSLPLRDAARCWVPARFYDMSGVGLPILALGPEGSEVQKLMAQHGLGRYCTSESLSTLGAADLQDLLAAPRAATNGLKAFERKAQAELLDAWLRELCESQS